MTKYESPIVPKKSRCTVISFLVRIISWWPNLPWAIVRLWRVYIPVRHQIVPSTFPLRPTIHSDRRPNFPMFWVPCDTIVPPVKMEWIGQWVECEKLARWSEDGWLDGKMAVVGVTGTIRCIQEAEPPTRKWERPIFKISSETSLENSESTLRTTHHQS